MYLCDIPYGTILCFNGSANYFMKTGYQGIYGVVNLSNGMFLTPDVLRKEYGLDPNKFSYVARTITELYQEGV